MEALLSQIGLGAVPIEIFAILSVWLLLTGIGYQLGNFRLDAIALSFIVATFLAQYIYSAWIVGAMLGGLGSPQIEIVVATGALTIACYLIFRRICDTGFVGGGSLISSAVSAIAVVAIMLALWSTALTTTYPFPVLLAPFFTASFTLLWLLGGLAVLSIMRQNKLF
jgi:hypothetical protein